MNNINLTRAESPAVIGNRFVGAGVRLDAVPGFCPRLPRERVDNSLSSTRIMGTSDVLQRALRQAELAAPTDATVLILGESGTGKELLADAIQTRSRRCDKPMVRVNCGAIPCELFESEFFGHAKGAFTGALKERRGRFEAANGGTLFLDEIAELSLGLQPKLLTVLQDGQFERVGDECMRKVDVRIIAATNRDLRSEVHAKRFRADLFFRLNVIPIEMPPLRERLKDIPELAAHFMRCFSRKLNRSEPTLTSADVQWLQNYHWPGNIRELQNVIERAIVMSPDDQLRLDLAWATVVDAPSQPTKIGTLRVATPQAPEYMQSYG